MNKINILVVGATGRMGRLLIKKIRKSKKFILNKLIVKNHKIFSHKIYNKFNISQLKKSDVIVDFSNPKASIELLKFTQKFKKKIVIGTTGFTKEQNELIKKASSKIAIFKSGNMSVGINLIEHMLEVLSKKIPSNYNILITDNHHKKKLDYPSGTALMLASAISNGRGKKVETMRGKIYLNKSGPIASNKINFFVKRKGKTIGEHSVNFNNNIETIKISHIAFSRELFAQGALDAAAWLMKKKKGLYDMKDLLQLK
jgi:4-hydroxy-tetrahydrodipicolinate reductase